MSSATVKNPVPPNRVAARDSRSELTSLPPRLPSPRSRPAIRPHALCVLDNKPSFLPPESHFLRTPPLFDQLNERFSLGSETPSSSLVAPYPSRTIANTKTVTTPRVFNRPPFEIQPSPPFPSILELFISRLFVSILRYLHTFSAEEMMEECVAI